MKNRDYKNFAPNCYFHLFNRGNAKNDIFVDDEDRKFFLSRLEQTLFPNLSHLQTDSPEVCLQGGSLVHESHTPYMRKLLPGNAFSLLCYTLMPNHFHFIIRQNTELPISKLFAKVFTGYSKYFNSKYKRVGHLFQDKFKAVIIETDAQLMWLSAYIHQNPKVAGLVEDLKDYQWSSYLDYIGLRNGTLCDKSFILKMFSSDKEYENFVEGSFEKIKQRKDIENLLLD